MTWSSVTSVPSSFKLPTVSNVVILMLFKAFPASTSVKLKLLAVKITSVSSLIVTVTLAVVGASLISVTVTAIA